jgi:hypothetical protein
MKTATEQDIKQTKYSFVLVLLICLSRPVFSQVGILGEWQTGTSHTKESGSDRALIFFAHGESASSMNLSAVKYGGQSMEKVLDYSYEAAGGYAYAAAFILDDAGISAASSGTFSPTWGGIAPGSSAYTSVFLQDVNQSETTGASDSGASTSNPVTTGSLATCYGDMVILAATCGNEGSYTLNNGFTEGVDQPFGGTVTGVTGYKSASGTSETPSATYSDWINRQMIIGFVVQAASVDPNKATYPNPSNGATDVSVSAGLSWDAPAGFIPISYDVYLGTDSSAHSNPKYTVDTNSYDPTGDLAEVTTYYWVVDCNDNGTIYTGDTWSFTTEGSYCGDGTCDTDEDCSTCETDCGICGEPAWRVDERCFLDGPSGEFDDIAVKDPSIVYSGGKWHLFYTGRDSSMWRIGYASATSISELNSATRYYMSSLNGGSYFCAPQVFWFEEKGKWYLIYQSGLGPTFSTNTDINNPNGWTAGTSMGFSGGVVDYWCISDGSYVYCFYSPLGTTILRRRTTVADFPYGWSSADVAVTDTFEAPHVYKNLLDGQYYMMVEDIARHQELWTASALGGNWTKVEEQWAHKDQLIYNADHWTDQVSHGEIIRAGTDERLEISNIDRCEILIQGVVDGDYGDYGNIPYDLGIIRNYPAGPINPDAGPDQTVYAYLDGYADVNLDGSGSSEVNDLPLSYYWSWSIDGNDYEANGVTPTIQLPIGEETRRRRTFPCDREHTIQLIADNGSEQSEPDYCTVNVIAPVQYKLRCRPGALSSRTRQTQIMAKLKIKGIGIDDIDWDESVIFYPGEIEGEFALDRKGLEILKERGTGSRQSVMMKVLFDRDLVEPELDLGVNTVRVVVKANSGQWYDFVGTMKVK